MTPSGFTCPTNFNLKPLWNLTKAILLGTHCQSVQLRQELPEEFPAKQYTFDAFTWARSSLASRCFAESHLENFLSGQMSQEIASAVKMLRLSPEEAERLSLDCSGMLCPLLDTGNHDPAVDLDVGLCMSRKGIHLGLARKSVVAAGQEYFINYGNHRSNLQLLLGHGFCLRDNPNDTMPMKLGTLVTK